MVDSVQVFPFGYRVTDVNGRPVNNAKIKFRHAGPGGPKTVYADAGLTIALGDTVRTRSDGQPVVSEGAAVTTLIYVGPEPYHIEITDADDAVIVPAKDDVKGAFSFSGSPVVIPPVPVITTGTNRTLTAAERGCLINATGNVLTFDDAVTLGDNWWVKVRNNAASGVVTLVASSGVSFEGQTFTRRALLPGEAMEIVCDGAAFRVSNHTPPLLAPQGPGLVTIVDRVSSAPGSPNPGERYIVSSGFDAFIAHQIIEYNGAGWNIYTPPQNCGWTAYVQAENTYYSFQGSAWVPDGLAPAASDTRAGLIERADAAEMKAASSTSLAVTPGRQRLHPGHPKAGGNLDGTGTPSIRSGDYGLAFITDDGNQGEYTLGFDTAFANTNYWCNAWTRSSSGNVNAITAAVNDTKTTSSFKVRVFEVGGEAGDNDTSEFGITFWGEYA